MLNNVKTFSLSVLAASVLLSPVLYAEDEMQMPSMVIVKKVTPKSKNQIEKEKINPDNGISEGFLDHNISLGALGKKQVLDTPYQVNTIPKEVIENSNPQGLQDVIKYIPSAQNDLS